MTLPGSSGTDWYDEGNRDDEAHHLSFPSKDVPATAAFFERHLGLRIDAQMDGFVILKRPGFDVVIDTATDASQVWPKSFHVGFELPTVEDDRALHDRLASDGVEMETGVITHERGSRFFCRAPGGVMFEMNTRADAAPAYRATFQN